MDDLNNGLTINLKHFLKQDYLKGLTDHEFSLMCYAAILCESMFEYKGLPDTIPEFIIERGLFWRGSCVVFKPSNSSDIMALPAAWDGNLNDYGQPMRARPISFSGKSYKDVKLVPEFLVGKNKETVETKAEGVLIRNNYMCMPTYSLIFKFIKNCSFILDSKAINAISSRIPVILKGTKAAKTTLMKEFNKLFGNKNPFTMVYDSNADITDVLDKVDLGIKYEPEKYWNDFRNEWALILKFVGINTNDANVKSSGVTPAEVEVNDEEIRLFRDAALKERKRSIEQVNKLFGCSASVEFRYKPDIKPVNNNEEEEEDK